ncbi:MAG: UDP-N-acetylglucosamine 2-epimerase (non-hydrolyzing) [Sphingobacteriales bacterium]|nr:MAG: UDP-N-acetylglucosamine 2-epimerase (non-hydrolyzing) [Sphingobacteriales bacterium]
MHQPAGPAGGNPEAARAAARSKNQTLVFMRIAIIIGTRPEAIKLIPLYTELRSRGASVELILFGQHIEMVRQIVDFFGVTPDEELSVMRPNQQLATLSAELLLALNDLFTRKSFDCVVVQGDTTTAMIATLAAFYRGIDVAHVEAGLRTYNLQSPFPEEANRQIIGRMARWNFAPTGGAAENLVREGVSGVQVVGNTVIDSLLYCAARVTADESRYVEHFPWIAKADRLVLITGHRRENFNDGANGILEAITLLAERHPDITFYYPVHLSPKVQVPVQRALSHLPNVILDRPLAYDELVFFMKKSFLILTDSGGIQEEAPSLRIPLIVLRDTTERPEGIERGCAVLAGTGKDAIVHHFEEISGNKELYERMAAAGNPYGDGTASLQIADALLAEG